MKRLKSQFASHKSQFKATISEKRDEGSLFRVAWDCEELSAPLSAALHPLPHASALGQEQAEAREALEQMVSSAEVDPGVLGGVRWPEEVETGAATPRGRFAVASVRTIETIRVASHGHHWKLKRVSGREVSLGHAAAWGALGSSGQQRPQGRVTREAEFVPAAWKEQLKRVSWILKPDAWMRT